MTKEAYCSFEVSKLLKEKGFDEPLCEFYEEDGSTTGLYEPLKNSEMNGYTKVTHQMALEWLREEKNLIITIDYDRYPISDENKTIIGYGYSIQTKGNPEDYYGMCVPVCNDYEESVEAALKYCLTKLI